MRPIILTGLLAIAAVLGTGSTSHAQYYGGYGPRHYPGWGGSYYPQPPRYVGGGYIYNRPGDGRGPLYNRPGDGLPPLPVYRTQGGFVANRPGDGVPPIFIPRRW